MQFRPSLLRRQTVNDVNADAADAAAASKQYVCVTTRTKVACKRSEKIRRQVCAHPLHPNQQPPIRRGLLMVNFLIKFQNFIIHYDMLRRDERRRLKM